MNKQNKAFLMMQAFMMILSMASATTIGGKKVEETKAEITSPYVRIWFARGIYYDWNDQGFIPLVYSDDGFEISTSVYHIKDINYFPPTGYVQDPGYYGGLTCTTGHYTMGLLYYDVELSKIENKYITFMYFSSKTTSDSAKHKVGSLRFSLTEHNTNSDIWLLTYMATFFDLTENPYAIDNFALGK